MRKPAPGVSPPAGEHDEIATEFAGEFDAASAGYGHLRRAMNREIRRELANPAAYSHVLHDGGVHSGRNDGAQVLVSLSHFVGEHERVEGDEALHALAMQEVENARQFLDGEVVGARPRIEPAAQPEVDGVRSGRDGGAQAFFLAGGREELGSFQQGNHRWVEHRGRDDFAHRGRCASHKMVLSATPPGSWQAPGWAVTY